MRLSGLPDNAVPVARQAIASPGISALYALPTFIADSRPALLCPALPVSRSVGRSVGQSVSR
ncbi:hypothetical protein, partial [Raoultella planticola]|uniref:hypothetical protein n=1 Tax=Raoultella planticola TaxID=575 RepID=UPI003A4C58DD